MRTVQPPDVLLPNADQFSSFRALTEAVARSRHGAAGTKACLSAGEIQEAEREILRRAQQDSFAEEFHLLSSGKPVHSTSQLLSLAPEYDETVELIRVGGRLRRSDQLGPEAVHPVILDPRHRVTQLIIQDTDKDLHHPGAERLFAELRRKYWVLHGREAVRRHQRYCSDCQRWRATPTVSKMADLPPARLRLMKPPFFSTGMDCFGPFTVTIGRRHEKRWGIVFKCLTTRRPPPLYCTKRKTGSCLIRVLILKEERENFRKRSRPCTPHFKLIWLNTR